MGTKVWVKSRNRPQQPIQIRSTKISPPAHEKRKSAIPIGCLRISAIVKKSTPTHPNAS